MYSFTSFLPEVALDIESITIKARKLKVVWSYEADQDLRSQINYEAEKELTDLLAKEIMEEIGKEVLKEISDSTTKKTKRKTRQVRSITDDWEVQNVNE